DARPQVRGRRRGLRTRWRYLSRIVRGRGRRQQRRARRRHHRGLPTIAGGAAGRAARRYRSAAVSVLTYVLAAIVGLAAGVIGVLGMLGVGMTWRLPALLPMGGVSLVLDPLAGVFLTMIGFAAVPASLYALGDTRHTRRGRMAYLLFVGAMAVVPVAGNALTFLLAWELMSLASYVLVVHDRESREAVRAAWVYAVMTHAGVACLIVGMLLLGTWTGSFEMTAWRAAAPSLLPWPRNLVWTLLALGFAVKAGVIPLHVWLPLAHPAAPRHVSALMSGVMIKLGVYGLIRVSLHWRGARRSCWPAPSRRWSACCRPSWTVISSGCSRSRRSKTWASS